MNFQNARFLTSAPDLATCPEPLVPEVCFAGRSNVGKSSLINALVNRKKLAFTSNVPGKTQTINYYDIDGKMYLVDLPGYGFAKVPEKERKRWGKAIKRYLSERSTLKLVLHIADARHKPTKLDEELFYWLASNQRPFAVLMSKGDKLSHNKRQKSIKQFKDVIEEMNIEVPIIPYSANKLDQIDSIRELILEFSGFE